MRKIARSVEEKILRRWLEGNSQRQTASEFGVGLATVNRVIQDAKKRMPDIEDLRQLNMVLQKSGITVADAVRACPILSRLDELGVGINELSEYVESSKKLATVQGVGAAELVESAIRLSKLEKETGKPYHEVVQEFEDKQAEVQKLDLKVKELDSQRVKIQGELTQAREKLSKTMEELKQAISAKERLQRLGLEKITALAKFVEDYERLGFKAEEVQKLAHWRKSLAEIGIDPDALENFIKKRGSLEKQLRSLEEELSQGRARLKVLVAMESDLRRKIRDIQKIEHILQSRTFSFACPHCGGVLWREVRRRDVETALSWGQPLTIVCPICHTLNHYDPRQLLINLSLEVLS